MFPAQRVALLEQRPQKRHGELDEQWRLGATLNGCRELVSLEGVQSEALVEGAREEPNLEHAGRESRIA